MPPVATNRPPTDEERALLRRSPARLFGWETGIVSSVCVFVVVFLVVLLASGVIPLAAVLPSAVVVASLAAIAGYARIQRRERRRWRRLAVQMDAEIAAGHVKSTRYTIRDAVAVEEAEDEGLSFYLLLDDGRTLFLSGQYLYEAADDREFPWASFEIVQAPVAGHVLRIARRGPVLRPSATRRAFTDEDYRSGAVPRTARSRGVT